VAELFSGWPVVLALGIIILVLGLIARLGLGKSAGTALIGLGLFWLLIMGLYVGLVSAGQYFPMGTFPVYSAPYILAILILIAGLAIAYRTARAARKVPKP
jgi:hypothetical protein